jgi:hypothetical protein
MSIGDNPDEAELDWGLFERRPIRAGTSLLSGAQLRLPESA